MYARLFHELGSQDTDWKRVEIILQKNPKLLNACDDSDIVSKKKFNSHFFFFSQKLTFFICIYSFEELLYIMQQNVVI